MGLEEFKTEPKKAATGAPSHNDDGDVRYKDEEWLREKMQSEQKTQSDVADICGVSASTVQYYQEKYSIKPGFKNQKNKSVSWTSKQIDVIEGTLLGDASIFGTEGAVNPNYLLTNSKRDYLEYVRSQLPGKLFSDNHTHTTTNGAGQLVSVCTKELLEIEKRWYNDSKTLPSEFKLNPVNLLHWYICDGTLEHEVRPTIDMMWTSRESAELLHSQVEDLVGGVEIYRYEKDGKEYHRISINKTKAGEFFRVIGDCPVESYKYKWL